MVTPARPDDVVALYLTLLERWNAQDAAGLARLFAPMGHVVGFDGSEIDGRDAIEAGMRDIFTHHKTGSYVGKVRSVRFVDGLAILRAVAGMAIAGQEDLNPELNTVQTLVASQDEGAWRVELFHNTPAALHGREGARDRLTTELREVWKTSRR